MDTAPDTAPSSTRGFAESINTRALAGRRIAVVTYPTLFQSPGGMAMKVRQTVRALQGIGVDATLANLLDESLGDFDLVHVFGAFNCNDRFVTTARGFGKPVVVSPVLMPPFTSGDGRLARIVDRLAGRITSWNLSTTYRQIRTALDGADRLLALGQGEREILVSGYEQAPSKVIIVPNGVGEQFFDATPDLFRKEFAIARPIVLHVGIIGEVKNQLGLVRALKDADVEIVLLGSCDDLARSYLDQCLAEGRGKVRYLGQFPHGHGLIASAYAAAAVLAVPSKFEGMSNCVLEALAAGTPVVTTKHHSWDFTADPAAVVEVEPTSSTEIRDGVMRLVSNPKQPERCRAVVSHLSWRAVAEQIAGVYVDLLPQVQAAAR